MEPVQVTCTADPCNVAVTMTVEIPPFNLDLQGAGQIAGAILAVWAVGWAFRMLIQTLRHTDGGSSSSTESE